MRFFGEISRVDEEQRMVWGYASTEQRAGDGKIITRAAMEGALDGYMQFANIREMHQLSAVGRAEEARVDEGGLYLGAKIIDEAAWTKVKERVYRGFSIGAKVTEYDAVDSSVITGMVLREISLVDRPSDPGAKFDLFHVDTFDDDDEATSPSMEDDMSRAARKPEAPASTPQAEPAAPAAAAPAAETVERTEPAAEPAPAAETAAAPAAEGAQAPAADAAGDEGGETERASSEPGAAPAEPAAEPTPVERAVQGAAEVQELLRARLTDATVGIVLPGAEIRRGMSLVARLGYLVSEAAYIVTEADWEKEMEGDNSPVPDMVRSALIALGDAYRAMSTEELTELLASVGAGPALDHAVIMFAADGGDLARTDATITEDQAARLQTALDAFVARGWRPVLQSADSDLHRAITELTADRDRLVETVDSLSADVRRLLDMPAPPKTGGALARAVDKTEDAAGPGASAPAAAAPPAEDAIARYLDSLPEDEKALALIRASRALPIPISNRPSS